MKEKTCCVTGHRDIPKGKIEFVKQSLRKEIQLAIADGYTHFISGFAEGADLFFAEIVADFCRERKELSLEGAIPYGGRLRRLEEKKETKQLLDACATISVISQTYAPDIYRRRNQYMVEQSERVIAVYDGRKTGGTAMTIRMTQKKGAEVREIFIETE